MCSHESVTWCVMDNFIADRMIDNSLIHKLVLSRKIRKRTKMLNAELEKCAGAKDYKQYVDLKTNVLRNLIQDADTDDTGNLTDTDYDIIYSSPWAQAKYVAKKFERCISISEEHSKSCEMKNNIKRKRTNNDKNTKAKIQKKKPLSAKCNTNVSHLFDNKIYTNILNNEENIFKHKECDYLKALSNNQSLSLQFDSQSSTISNIIESVNGNTIRQNYRDSNIVVNELNLQNSTISSNTKSISKSKMQNCKDQNVINESNVELDLQSPYKTSLSRLLSLQNINDVGTEFSTVMNLENSNNSKFIEADEKSLIDTKNDDNIYVNYKTKLLQNVRRNLIPTLKEVDFTNIKKDKNVENRLNDELFLSINSSQHNILFRKMQTDKPKIQESSSEFSFLKQQKDSGFDEDSQDEFIKLEQSKQCKRFNNIKNSTNLYITKDMPVCSEQSKNVTTIVETITLNNSKEDTYSKSYNILKEQDSKEAEEPSGDEEVKNSLQLNQIDKNIDIYSINQEDKTCNIQNQQLLPKITCTEIINKKFKIIQEEINDISSNVKKVGNINNNTTTINNYIHIKNNALINCPNVNGCNIDNCSEEMANVKEIDNNLLMTSETDNEENNTDYVSPQTIKRLQQQARLNLVVSSDSSESNDEAKYAIIETSRKHVDSSDTNHCKEDCTFKSYETDCTSEKNSTNVSHSKYIYIRSKEATLVSTEEIAKINLINIQEETKQNTQYCENIHNSKNNWNEYMENIESFQLRVPESNASHNYKEHINHLSRDNPFFLLNKENMCDKNIQCKDRINVCTDEFETKCKSEHKQNAQISTKHSNVHHHVSSHYRPHNLEQLVEDQELFVETIPTSFTLADLSEYDEAFILNIPNKVLQCNLQDKLLTLKEKTIKIGESKYRIIRNKVDTISCLFATGKKRRPYKTVNLDKISTITVQEKLSHHSRKLNVSNYYDNIISSELKATKTNNQRTDEFNLKMPKDLHYNKRKRRCSSSDFETKQSVVKKK